MGLLSGLGGILGGIVGGIANNGDEDAANAAYAKALEALQNVKTPDDLANPIVLQSLQQAGMLTPELIQKLPLNADQKQTLIENQSVGKTEQQNALMALKQLSQTGLSPADLAAYRQMQSKVAQDTQAKTNQILAAQQARGQAGSGDALAAQLNAAQASSQNASSQADQIAQAATDARRQALSQFANLSGQMRGTDLDTQKLNLQNELERQRFIDQNSLARQQQNVANQNAANMYNLQRQQNVSDYNTQQQNQELYAQKYREQQLFNDQMQKAKGLSGVYGDQGKRYTQQANATAQNWANMGQGLGQGIESMASMGGGSSGGSGGGHTNNIGFGSGGTMYNADDQTAALNGFKFAASGGLVPEINTHSAVANIRKLTEHEDKMLGSVPTDSEHDDKVPTMLSPGEIVIPKSFSHDPDLAKAYINFVHKQKKQTIKK